VFNSLPAQNADSEEMHFKGATKRGGENGGGHRCGRFTGFITGSAGGMWQCCMLLQTLE